MEEHEDGTEQEGVNIPEESVEDLEPNAEESEDVAGGAYHFKSGWPTKFEGPTTN